MKKLLLKDVAKHVGVSTALVSYVLNGQAEEKQVNKETAKKILKAVEELNYRPNQIAKSLKMQKTYTIGLVVADINYRFSTGITRAIESEAKKNKYTVIYGSSNEDKDKFSELVNVFVNRRVDGLILVAVENSQEQIRQLQKSGTPFVLIDRIFPDIKTNYIALDNYQAAYAATEYLIKTGHKRIALVSYDTSLFHLLERNRGYFEALKDYNIAFKKDWHQKISNAKVEVDVRSGIDHALALKQPCDALFLATDTLTLHALKYLNEKGLKVPDDISILSFDGSDVFDLFYCPITHSRQPLEEMGKLAVNTVIELINHGKISKQISLEADLRVGRSCKE